MMTIAYEGVLSLRGMSCAGGQSGRRVSMGALSGKEGEAQELIKSFRPTPYDHIKTICGENIERYCFFAFSTAGGGTASTPKAMYNIQAHGGADLSVA